MCPSVYTVGKIGTSVYRSEGAAVPPTSKYSERLRGVKVCALSALCALRGCVRTLILLAQMPLSGSWLKKERPMSDKRHKYVGEAAGDSGSHAEC